LLIAAGHAKLRTLTLCEDEVTSSIFGVMQYLPALDVWKIISIMAKDAGIREYTFHEEPELEAQYEFWPHWETDYGYVEPDLVIHFRRKGIALLHLIIEIKWESIAKFLPQSNLSLPCQLARQWGHRDTKSDGAPWMHLYVVSDTSKGRTDVEQSLEDPCFDCSRCQDRQQAKGTLKGRSIDVSEWRKWLGCIGWRHFCTATSDAQPYGSWVKEFLSKYGIVSFMGFAEMQVNSLDEAFAGEDLFFHVEPWFVFLSDAKINPDETDNIFFLYSTNWFVFLNDIKLDSDEVKIEYYFIK
jgi:hypothetical protein